MTEPAPSPSLETPPADPESADPLLFLASVIGLGLAVVGALQAASLLTYSPTKLARKRGGEALLTYLDRAERDHQLLARSLVVLGLAVAAVSAWVGSGSTIAARLEASAILVALAILGCGALPAAVAESRPETIVARTVPWLRPLATLLRYPLLLPVRTINGWLVRSLRLAEPMVVDESDRVAEDILTAVSDSAMENDLPDEERHWIENIVELKDMHASGVMTPRTDVIAFPRTMRIQDAVLRAIESGFSRYPVFDDTLDSIIGVFYAKDALQLVGDRSPNADRPVGDFVRTASAVPETMNLVDLLRHFRASKKQMAIVRDEYGGTSGVVTIEDVLEEIVGDIEDEYDPEQQGIRILEEGASIEVTGRTRVDEANEHIGDRLPECDDYDTVAGWVFTALERVPRTGEEFLLDGVEIAILEADERRIVKMRIRVPRPAPEPDQAPPPPK